jgi:hypothetical protein
LADPGRRLGPNAVAVLVLIALGAGLLLWQRPWQGAADPAPAFPADAPARLAAQFRVLSAADTEAAFVAAAGPSRAAGSFARAVWDARRTLTVSGVSLRYVSGGDVADRADGSAAAEVDVSWRGGALSGRQDSAVHTATVSFRVVPQDGARLSVVGAAGRSDALPTWLAGVVTVERTPGSTVVRVDGGDRGLPVESMVAKARSAVARVVPGPTGAVSVVSPHTQRQMAQLVGQPVAQVEQVAAVTTQLGSGRGAGSDTVVVLNPAVFTTMDRRAAQVVVTHEATHVLTGVVGTRAESWVVEGFADYVALHADTAPLSVSAGQVLTEVRGGTLPKALPTETDFSATGHGLGAVYESAWMIFRMLGARFGDADVLRFYTAVTRGDSLAGALRSSFGLTVAELTTDWRRYLEKSASTVS